MKNINRLLLFFAFIISGCAERLELEPVSYITSASFYKTENDVDGALNGLYVKLRSEGTSNLFIWGEARSEMMERSLAGTLGYEKYYDHTLSSTLPGPGWDNLYSLINAINLVLKYTPDIKFTSEAKKNDLLAQAYTMRAFAYFILAKTWGDIPLRLTPMESYDPATIQVPRTPKAEIFTQIKSDIEKALQLFPNNSYPSGRNKWSKNAAYALKGDVYLWTGKTLNGGNTDITAALTALTVIQTSDVQLLPNYVDIFKYTNKGSKEILMAIRYQLNEEAPEQVFSHNMYLSNLADIPSYVPQSQKDIIGVPKPGNGNVWRITQLVRDQFTDDDKRKSATYLDVKGPNPNQYYTNYGLKYNGVIDLGVRYFFSDYILYRYADVLLMIAEAKNALGQDPTTEINLVRQRAYGTSFSTHAFVNGSKVQNDDAILKERLFELSLEGKRWWDLIRFGKAFELVPDLQGKQSKTHLLVWPIGTSLLSKETLVKETPGYE